MKVKSIITINLPTKLLSLLLVYQCPHYDPGALISTDSHQRSGGPEMQRQILMVVDNILQKYSFPFRL